MITVHINPELLLEDLVEQLDEQMFTDKEIDKVVVIFKDLLGL